MDAGVEIRRGEAPVVVYAPHGGRRTRPVRRGDSVNDLHTAEIALEIAERLGASALVNSGVDRNGADLNRISVLAGPGRRVLAALRSLVEHASGGRIDRSRAGADLRQDDDVGLGRQSAVAAPRVPLVLSIHGWNVAVPACDVGVGLVERRGYLTGAHPTLSRAALDGFVRRLARGLEARGIEAPIGRRYPAAGRDNGTQLFSGRHAAHESEDVAALSTLARLGGVDGVQLELAIPLRWPGRYRRDFVDALVEAAAEECERRREGGTGLARDEWRSLTPSASGARSGPDQRGDCAPLRPGWSVQAVLPDGGGLFIGAEPTAGAAAAARLCVVRPDGRMLLFVGEGDWEGDEHRHHIGGFDLCASVLQARSLRAEGTPAVDVRYDGPMVVYPTHDAFCDLEIGLAGAVLTMSQVQVRFESLPERDGVFGRLRGWVRTDDEALEIDCLAVCERGSRRGGAARAPERVFVTAGRLAPTAAVGGAGAACEWLPAPDGEIGEILLRLDDGRQARARVLTRVPVYRVLARDTVVKVTFGTAALGEAGDDGAASDAGSLALFERIELLGPT